MKKEIRIGTHKIGVGYPVYIVAEMSANHLMDYDRAVAIIDAAKQAGADAVKLQTYTADTITVDCGRPEFQIHGGLWDGETLYSLYQKAYTPWEWQPDLKKYADSIGLDCFSSPFDPTSVDFLEKLNVPAYKIAAPEIMDIPLIRKVARLGKPVIISTGIAHLEDIERAVRTCLDEGNDQVILLKCTSAYPCPYEDVHLKTMPLMGQTFGCLAGLSDHTFGSEVPLGAVSLGAVMIEKHITIKRSDGGPDGGFSMEAEEFTGMVRQIRNLEKAMGTGAFILTEAQEAARAGARSLYIVRDVKMGEALTSENIRSIRPGLGLHTMYYEQVLGKKARMDLKKGTPLERGMFE